MHNLIQKMFRKLYAYESEKWNCLFQIEIQILYLISKLLEPIFDLNLYAFDFNDFVFMIMSYIFHKKCSVFRNFSFNSDSQNDWGNSVFIAYKSINKFVLLILDE